MRHYVILLLILIQVLAFTKEAPVFLIRNDEPFVRLAVVGPSIGISISYENTYKSGMIRGRHKSEGYYLDSVAKKDPSQPYLALFPDYPARLYISDDGLNHFRVIAHFDKKLQTLVIFNPVNGLWLELNDATDIKMLSPVKASPKDPVSLDIVKLKELIVKYDGLLKDIGAPLLYCAAEFGDIPTLTLLLDANVSPNIKSNINLYTTALQLAVERKQSKAAILLISRGAVATSAGILSLAIQNNDIELVKVMLEHEADPNMPGDNGLTALHIAASVQNTDMAKLLIEHGAEVNSCDELKRTPLITATDPTISVFGQKEEYITHISNPELHKIVDLLITAGADINAVDDSGNSVLSNTVKLLDYQQYQMLLARPELKPLNKNANAKLLMTLLHSVNNYKDQMKRYLDIILDYTEIIPIDDKGQKSKPREMNEDEKKKVSNLAVEEYSKNFTAIFTDILKRGVESNSEDYYPLNLTINWDDLTYANQLIDAGVDINFNSPINAAVANYNIKGIDLLLKKGADVSKISPYLFLDFEFVSGDDSDEENRKTNRDNILTIAKLLVKYKANMTERDSDWGGQAIHHAVNIGFPELVELLLDNGADIEAGDNGGTTPLGIASESCDVDIMTLLIKRGAKINVRDKDGSTPLSYIIKNQIVEGIQLLLRQPGIDLKIKDENGISYLMMEVEDNNNDNDVKWDLTFCSELLKQGCKIDDVDNDGRTALHHAVNSHPLIVKYLLEHGAKINQADKDGNTPLHLLVIHILETENEELSVVKLLVENGANINARNKAGESIINLVKNNKTSKLAVYLRSYQEKTLKKKK